MSKYVNTSGLRKPDWLWATLKKNPEGLLFLAAGCALLLRRARFIGRAEQARSDAQEYLGQGESIPHDTRLPMLFGVVHVCIATGLEAWCDCSANTLARTSDRHLLAKR